MDPTRSDHDAYKRAKEAFVSDLHGTTPFQVSVVFMIMPGCQWLYSELLTMAEITGLRGIDTVSTTLSLLWMLLFEFVVLVLPTQLAMTIAHDSAVRLIVMVYTLAMVLCGFSHFHASEQWLKYFRKAKMNLLLQKQIPFVTNFRAQVMLSTCIAILAVDFPAFPRGFAKTETFGYSVMDTGVGAFVMSSALTSPYARQLDSKPASAHQSLLKRIIKFLQPIAIVTVLGFARLLSLKSVDYQEHASEYGVHWNFYFTLGGVYLLYGLLECFGTWATSSVGAAVIMSVYQVYLSVFNGEEFILHAPRTNLFSQNREGILSLAGYLGVYLFSVAIGRQIFSQVMAGGGTSSRQSTHLFYKYREVALRMVEIFTGCCLLTFLSVQFVALPSRRMMNTSYAFWVLTQAMMLVVLYAIIQQISLSPRTSLLFAGISSNQLFIFLIGNLATGIVNLSMRTIYASDQIATAVLVVYLGFLCVVASVLERLHIRIKL